MASSVEDRSTVYDNRISANRRWSMKKMKFIMTLAFTTHQRNRVHIKTLTISAATDFAH